MVIRPLINPVEQTQVCFCSASQALWVKLNPPKLAVSLATPNQRPPPVFLVETKAVLPWLQLANNHLSPFSPNRQTLNLHRVYSHNRALNLNKVVSLANPLARSSLSSAANKVRNHRPCSISSRKIRSQQDLCLLTRPNNRRTSLNYLACSASNPKQTLEVFSSKAVLSSPVSLDQKREFSPRINHINNNRCSPIRCRTREFKRVTSLAF